MTSVATVADRLPAWVAFVGRDRSRVAWIVSLVGHAVILALFVRLVRESPVAHRPAPVTLVAAPASPTLPSLPPPRTRAWSPDPFVLRPPAPLPFPTPIDPAQVTAPESSPWERPAVEVWTDRSLVPWVTACRQGTAAPDSLLDSPRSAAELAQVGLVGRLNSEFALRRDDWRAECFREAYAQNFPLMR